MPAQFNSLGISFKFPDNWTLDNSDARLGRKSITVYGPGGAFWSVAIHAGSAEPAKMSAAVVKAMEQEYDGLEAEADGGNHCRSKSGWFRSRILLPRSHEHRLDSQPAGCQNDLYDLLPSGR